VSARRVIASAVFVAFLALGACSGSGGEPSPVIEGPSTSVSVAGTASTSSSATTAASTSAPSGVTEIRIGVAGGKVTGGGRHKVPVGTPVRFVVTADVTDEVHLHGYDLKANVTPTAPATLDVVAKVPGIFEIELEKKGLQLAQLEVTG
jgi:hypothetical protein